MPSKPIPDFEMPDDLETKYVNFVRIAHTGSEFVLDFSLLLPGTKHPQVDSRLVMSATAVKLFVNALHENIQRYEANYGDIQLPGKPSLADGLFQPNESPE